MVTQLFMLVLLPLFLKAYDPMGIMGMVISVAIWFVGGIVVGIVSPGKTFVEPAVGALLTLIPTISYLRWITPEGFDSSLLAYLVMGLLGAMWALFGSFIGEKVQGGAS